MGEDLLQKTCTSDALIRLQMDSRFLVVCARSHVCFHKLLTTCCFFCALFLFIHFGPRFRFCFSRLLLATTWTCQSIRLLACQASQTVFVQQLLLAPRLKRPPWSLTALYEMHNCVVRARFDETSTVSVCAMSNKV